MRCLGLACLVTTVMGFMSHEFSDRVYGACDAPPLHIIAIPDLSIDGSDLLPRLSSAVNSMILRSGCVSNSSIGVIANIAAPVVDYKLGEIGPAALLTEIRTMSQTSSNHLQRALELAREQFDIARTEVTGAHAIVIMTIAFDLPLADISAITATAAGLLQRGTRILAIAHKIADQVEYPASADTALAARRRSLRPVVSSPPDRHILHVFVPAQRANGDYVGSFPDMGLAGYVTPSTLAGVLPVMDPRTASTCMSPTTCIVAAGGRVRTAGSDVYNVQRTGEYVLTAFRAPHVGEVVVYGGFVACADDRAACLVSLKVLSQTSYVSVNAAAGHDGSRLMMSGLATDDIPHSRGHLSSDDARTYAALDTLRVQHMSASGGTWRGAESGWNPTPAVVESYAVQVMDTTGPTAIPIAYIHIDADVHAAHLSVSMVLAGEAVPTRSGLCGVPAGAVGDAAAPAARIPHADAARHSGLSDDDDDDDDPFAAAADAVAAESGRGPHKRGGARGASRRLAGVAARGATRTAACPPTASGWRPLVGVGALRSGASGSDAVAVLQAAAGVTPADVAAMLRVDPASDRAARRAAAQRTTVTAVGDVDVGGDAAARPRNADCVAAFGPHSVATELCDSNARVGHSAPVFPVLRAVSALCRIRCLNPDSEIPESAAEARVVRGGTTQAGVGLRGGVSEILGDLVTPAWCETNICKLGTAPLVPALIDPLASAPGGRTESGWVSTYAPHWVTLTTRPRGAATVHLAALDVILNPRSERAFLTPPVAGRYSLRATVAPTGCAFQSANVTVTVRCPAALATPDAGRDVDVPVYAGGYPWVSLLGAVRVAADDLATPPPVSIYWTVASVPPNRLAAYEGPHAQTVNVDDVMVFPSSIAPMFRPPWGGEWVLAMHVFDGCAVVADNVTVTARCAGECGGGSLDIRSAPTIRLDGGAVQQQPLRLRAVGAAELGGGFVAFGAGAARSFNLTTPHLSVHPLVPTNPIVTGMGRIPGAVTSGVEQDTIAFLSDPTVDRFSWFIEKYHALGLTTSAPLSADAVIGYAHTHTVPTSVGASADARWHARADAPPPDVCGVDFGPPPTSQASTAVPIAPSLPQTTTPISPRERRPPPPAAPSSAAPINCTIPAVSTAWYAAPAGVTLSAVPSAFDPPSRPPTAMAVSTVRRVDACRGAAPADVVIAIGAFDAPHAVDVPIVVSAHSDMSPDAFATRPGGQWGSTVIVEYLPVAAGADYNVSAGGPWLPAAAEVPVAAVDSGIAVTVIATVGGPVHLRVRLRLADASTVHAWEIDVRDALAVIDRSVKPGAVCHGQRVRIRAQLTDGCTLYSDTADTTFACDLPPRVELLTPHYDLSYDYDAATWPPLYISVNEHAAQHIHVAVLSNASLGLPSNAATDISTYETDLYTYRYTAYTNVPGVAPGALASPKAEHIALPPASAAALSPTSAPICDVVSHSGSPALLASSATAWRLLRSGPPAPAAAHMRETPDGYYLGVGCGGAAEVESIVHIITNGDVISDPNVTHVNITYRLYAHSPLLSATADSVVLRFASFANDDSHPALAAVDTDAIMAAHGALFRDIAVVDANVQTAPSDTFITRWHVVPVMTGPSSVFALRFDIRRRDPTARAGTDVRGVVGFTDIALNPAYVSSVEGLAGGPQQPFIVTTEGTSRFSVSASTDCATASSFIDVRATCLHPLPPQRWAVYAENDGSGRYLVRSVDNGASSGVGVIHAHPYVAQSLVVVVENGTQVARGSGTAAFALVVGGTTKVGIAADAATWATYGSGDAHPGELSVVGPGDLRSGTHARVDAFHVRRAAADASVAMHFSDGCRARVERATVSLMCSATVFKAPRTFVLDSGYGAVDGAALQMGQPANLFFVSDAHYTPHGAGGVERNISQRAGVTVEVMEYTPSYVPSAAAWVAALEFTGVEPFVTRANATDGQVLAFTVPADASMVPFELKVSGRVTLRITHHFHATDCVTAVPYEIVVGTVAACPLVAVSHRGRMPEDFAFNHSVDIPAYSAADFASHTTKGRAALIAYYSTLFAGANIPAYVVDAVNTGTTLTVVIAGNHSTTDITDLVAREVGASVLFSRTFGEVASASATPLAHTPYTIGVTWEGNLAARLGIDTVTAGGIPVCGAGATPPCPAYDGTDGRVALIDVDTTWATPGPVAVADGAQAIVVTFANAHPSCTAATSIYAATCRRFIGPPKLTPMAAVGVHGESHGAALMAASGPSATTRYGHDEPRGFQRVYLYDSAPHQSAAVGVFIGTADTTPYAVSHEWWVRAAPPQSMYAPTAGAIAHVPGVGTATYTTFGYTTVSYDAHPVVTTRDYWTAPRRTVARRVTTVATTDSSTSDAKWRFVRLPSGCLRDHPDDITPPWAPASEACFTPDVAGTYELVYRAQHVCHSPPTWYNATVIISAVCPPLIVSLSSVLPTRVAVVGVGVSDAAAAAATLNFGIDVEVSDSLRSHIHISYLVTFTPTDVSPSSSACSASWEGHDLSDTNATFRFPCAGRYNVSAVVTDGCTLKVVTHIVETYCAITTALAGRLGSRSVVFTAPEGAQLADAGSIEVSPGGFGLAEALKFEGLGCADALSWVWEVTDFVAPGSAIDASTNEFVAPATRIAAGSLAAPSAVGVEAAGLTTLGDVLATIMSFAIGTAVLISGGLLGLLFATRPPPPEPSLNPSPASEEASKDADAGSWVSRTSSAHFLSPAPTTIMVGAEPLPSES